jgi:DNA helicase II / ATP-dependent DNA helicase PcrA
MSTKKDWREEQQRVDFVVDEINKKMCTLQQAAGEKMADILTIRKSFWENVAVNFDDASEVAETYASIKQQTEVLSESERTFQHSQKQLATLGRLKESPYFGRIDFWEEGEDRAEPIYLGIASFLDEDDQQFLVYDWRAPVSSLYYDYPPGPARYDTPSGTINGTIDLKRQYMIRNGQIQSLFDTGVTIGDELLQEVLGKHSDAQMKSIVATIQKEQNQIIRNERSGLLIVQGAAGSGKTSAALQRAAYLLYRYRGTLRADQIVLFSPNPIFNSYISTVLPELGEENMQQTTFQEYLEHRLSESFSLEDPFTQMEFVLTATDSPGYKARAVAIQYKASFDFMHVIEQYVGFLGKVGLLFKNINFRGEVLISAEQIRDQFYSFDFSISIPNRMNLLANWLLKLLKELARAERTKPWVHEQVELLNADAYRWAYKELRRKNRFTENTFDDFEQEQTLLAEKVVEKHFQSLRAFVKSLQFINMTGIYRKLYEDPHDIAHFAPDAKLPDDWAAICEQTKERIDRAELAYEDATPYLYLKERLEGFQSNHSIRHVFIDEAQDYSPFQFAFIKRLFPRSKMTILGDLSQAIFAHANGNEGFMALAELCGTELTEKYFLKRSYRSTKQIVEFTRGLIGRSEEIETFQREGAKPTVTGAATKEQLAQKVTDRIRTLQKDGHKSIAVICKTVQESLEAYEMLCRNIPLQLIGKETTSFDAGAVVIPSYLAKGVEFDAVIIYNGSGTQYGRDSGRNLFYTACTRAMHVLYVYFVGEMSPLISAAASDSYVMGS